MSNVCRTYAVCSLLYVNYSTLRKKNPTVLADPPGPGHTWPKWNVFLVAWMRARIKYQMEYLSWSFRCSLLYSSGLAYGNSAPPLTLFGNTFRHRGYPGHGTQNTHHLSLTGMVVHRRRYVAQTLSCCVGERRAARARVFHFTHVYADPVDRIGGGYACWA